MAKPLPLLMHADDLVEKLRAMVPSAIKDGDAIAIHQARVATRRLKTVLDVFEPILTRTHTREFASTLKKLRRKLGPLRDSDVMIEHLKELETPQKKAAIDWASARISLRQTDLRKAAAKKTDIAKVTAKLGAWWGVRQECVEAGEDLKILIAESLALQLDLFIAHADGITGRIVPGIHSQLLDPHQLRIAAKELRYTLEMAIAGGHKLPMAVARSFKKMQDALGLWHDYVVLGDELLKLSLESALGHHDADLQIGVLDVARVTVGRSKKELATFSKLWNHRGEELATTIRRAFPLTQAVTEPQTDQHPAGLEAPVDNSPPPAQDEPSAA